jgi:hypothetical protein
METKAAYKGTDQNCQCRGYQYEVGQEYEHKGSIDVCSWGFHACENPLDTFSYYPPDGKNRFFEVEQSGETKTKEDKTVSQRIKIKAEMTLEQFFAIGFKLIFDKVKKTVTESELTANTSGDYAHANTSGYKAHANTSGNYAHANTSGDEAHANTSGDEAIACSLGVRARARAVKGWIILVDWRRDGDKWTIRSIHHAKVGQKIGRKVIKSNEQYWFEDGKLKYEVCNG